MHLCLGSYVDAARGLIENQYLRLRRKPLGQDYFLLVSSGELAHRLHVTGSAAELQALSLLVSDDRFFTRSDPSSGGERL